MSGETILIVDATNGAPKGQIDLTFKVLDMGFTSDGSEIIVFDGNTVHFIDAQSGEESRNSKANDVEFYENAPYFTDISWFDDKVKVYSTKDGALVGSTKFEFTPVGAGFNADFTELLVLSKGHEIQKEKSLVQKKVEV